MTLYVTDAQTGKKYTAKEYIATLTAENERLSETLRKLQGTEPGFKPITCADCERSDQKKIDILLRAKKRVEAELEVIGNIFACVATIIDRVRAEQGQKGESDA